MGKNAEKMRKADRPRAAYKERLRVFGEAIAQGASGAEAARRAGYSGGSNALSTRAGNLLRKREVKEIIDRAREASTSKSVATAKQLKEFWTRVANGEELDNGMPPKMSDRLKASEMLGKTQAIFIDKVKHEGTIEHEHRYVVALPAEALRTIDATIDKPNEGEQ